VEEHNNSFLFRRASAPRLFSPVSKACERPVQRRGAQHHNKRTQKKKLGSLYSQTTTRAASLEWVDFFGDVPGFAG
jgi:hypothetical protein